MKTKTPVPSPRLPCTSVLLAVVAGLVVWVGVQQRQMKAQQERNARLQAGLEIARQRALDAEARLAALRARAAFAPRAPNPDPKAGESAAAADSPTAALPPALLDNPALQALMAAAAKGSLDARYGLLFRKLELDPGRRDRLAELLTERRMNALDLVRASQAQGLGTAQIEALVTASDAEIGANIRLLLGQPAYERFQDYEKNIEAYGVLADLERRLGPNNAPLNDTQSEALLRVLAENSAGGSPAGPPEDPLARILRSLEGSPSATNASARSLLTNRTLEAIGPLLNESQLGALRELQAEEQARLDIPGAPSG